ncbi:MAG: hypothetical protein Q7Q73_09385 [Verrucomicrobiota bacterium JB024]|nr:hypothetical protein [Verrucomicrobiota bacterium JB024]
MPLLSALLRPRALVGFCLLSVCFLNPTLRAEETAPASDTQADQSTPPTTDDTKPAEKPFEALFFATLQDPSLDWWTYIPPNTGPYIQSVSKLYRGQQFILLPFAVHYERDADSRYAFTYSIRQTIPAQDAVVLMSGIESDGVSPSPFFLIPMMRYPIITMEESDPYGTYGFAFEVEDTLSGQRASKEVTFELIPWENPEPLADQRAISEGMLEFYRNHDPKWLFAAYQSPALDMVQDHTPTGYNSSSLYFFKSAFEHNKFLLPHLRAAFADNNEQQRLNTLLLLAVLGEPPMPDEVLSQTERDYQADCRTLKLPDPYGPIQTPDQLDMLWGEFFATGTYAPIEHLVTALNLKPYGDAFKKMKEEGKRPETDEERRDVRLGLTFGAAVWSLMANCRQHELVKQYCGWALEHSDQLKEGKLMLAVIMSEVWPERYKLNRPEKTNDAEPTPDDTEAQAD